MLSSFHPLQYVLYSLIYRYVRSHLQDIWSVIIIAQSPYIHSELAVFHHVHQKMMLLERCCGKVHCQ